MESPTYPLISGPLKIVTTLILRSVGLEAGILFPLLRFANERLKLKRDK